MAVAVALMAGACGGPTAPSTGTDGPLTAICAPALTFAATSALGAVVHYPHAAAAGGRLPYTVSCAPGSGQTFAVGATPVTCTVTDAATATASCGFALNVSPPPRLSRAHFLAFGDSITAGELTVPALGPGRLSSKPPLLRQVVVPALSYPANLTRMLAGRYVAQAPMVVNAGQSGESAGDAEPRLLHTLLTDRPDAVLLLMGYNDLGSSARRLRAVAIMDRMAKDVRGYGARLFIATLTPGIPGRFRSLEPSAILAYNDAIRAIAVGEGAALVDLHGAFQPHVDAWIGVDGLHPTEAGYALIAETFFAAIRAELEPD